MFSRKLNIECSCKLDYLVVGHRWGVFTGSGQRYLTDFFDGEFRCPVIMFRRGEIFIEYTIETEFPNLC